MIIFSRHVTFKIDRNLIFHYILRLSATESFYNFFLVQNRLSLPFCHSQSLTYINSKFPFKHRKDTQVQKCLSKTLKIAIRYLLKKKKMLFGKMNHENGNWGSFSHTRAGQKKSIWDSLVAH